MTICIAALAEGKKKVVVAADKMLSLNSPIPYQFEPEDLSKIYQLGNNAVVMAAGNTLFCDEVSKLAVAKVSGTEDKSKEMIVSLVGDAFQEVRRRTVVEAVLKPRNLTYSEYLERQQTLHESVIKNVEDSITTTNIGVDLLIAGYDQGECYIYVLQHPGVAVSVDIVGYACIGVGAPHAQIHFIESNYQKNLSISKVEALVLAAKKKSEYAPGVGTKTDKLVLPTG